MSGGEKPGDERKTDARVALKNVHARTRSRETSFPILLSDSHYFLVLSFENAQPRMTLDFKALL